ncbi:receptor-type tyrosine-protein phosphatase H-like [Mytilus trossulus]|uniref:receptor-type tyrosine-protein phosphatase H-like n=1 Tax=Mytilus trossulus TaxID=6551 RepID=UPI003004DAAD
MIMEKLDIRTIYIIFASAFLVNPVLLQNNTTTISTSQISSSQVPPSTATMTIVTTPSATNTTITTTESATTPMSTDPLTTTTMPTNPPTTPLATNTTLMATTPLAITTQPTITTTTEPMTTAVPIGIGKNCSSSPGSCESSDSNSECKDETCQCKIGFFLWNTTCIALTSLLPTSLSLNSTETAITVAWVRPTGLNSSEYKLEFNVTVKGDNFDQTNTTKEEIITVSGLTAGQIYNVYVLTVFNDSIPSESINGSVATTPNPPDCPQYRNSYNAPNINITWNQTAGADRYGVKFENRTSLYVKTAMAEIDNLVPGRNYTLTLKTYMHNKTSDEGTCVIRTESEVPDPPKNVTLVGTVGKTNFNISIIAPDDPRGDIDGYRINIYGKNYEDKNFTYRNSVFIGDTMDNIYQVTGLQAGTFYSIQVYTVNDKFNSSDSLNLTGLRTAQDVPEAITNFTPISSNDSFKVMFERPNVSKGDIIGYRIRVSDHKTCIKEFYLQNTSFSPSGTACSPAINSSITPIKLNQKEMKLNVTDLEPSIDYIVNIWAYTSVGEGSLFNVTVMTGISAPYKPRNVEAVGKTKSVLVTWKEPEKRTGKTSYIVEAFDYLFNRSVVGCNTPTFTATSCTVTNLEDFWRYTFQVTAKVGNWTNASDKTAVITTLAGTPGKPAKFVTSLEDKGCKATLSWWTPVLKDRNADIKRYTIFIDAEKEIYTVNDHDPYNKMNTQFFKTFTFRKETTITVLIFSGVKEYTSDRKDAELRYVDTHGCYDPLTGGEIAGIIICVLLLLAVFGMVGFMVHKRWECVKAYLPEFRRRQSSGEFEPLQPPPERYRLNNESMKRPIVLSAIGDFLRKYHADDNRLFIGEYEDLKQLSPRHTTNSANLDENKPKNRYTNILPYDHSRVILAPMVDEEDSSDYINANYIPGYIYGKEFIASQGPLPGTANDFWRMIWEQSVSIIVMLTKCSENNMDKCEHYWPHDANEPKCYNDLMVNVTSVSNMGQYDIHVMDVCLGDEKRVVKHFHFLEWPDFSAKVETTTLIEFITTVRQHITPDIKGPTVTHCSAGVGRTGTFITVDYLMQFVQEHDLSSQVDIFDWVIQMRDHRTTMVQTWAQYAFIHDCLLEIVERKRKLQNPEPEENGEVCIDNLAYEPDDLYENTKLGPLQTEL